MMHPNRRAGLAFVFACLVLAACTAPGEPSRKFVERSVDELYTTGLNHLEKKQYKRAVNMFEEVERQHPSSVFAVKAQLMAAFTYYSDQEYDDAINALDRYIESHPGNRDIPYAYYLRGLAHYDQIADVRRDQQATEEAVEALEEVARRFPDTDYAKDASVKLVLARDHLAGKEMDVGRYYLRRKNFTAAINRFQNVVDNFDTTTHVPEAMHRLVETFVALGLYGEARETAAVLGHNYPGSQWYADSYELVTGEEIATAEDGEESGILDKLWPF